MVALKLGRSTYFQWKKKYQEHGLDGLKVRPLPGAASKLTDRQTSQLRGWLVGRDPRQFQFKEGAEVYFGDESGVRTDHHAGTTWAPVGQTPGRHRSWR